MTEEGLQFYEALESTWKELADAVHALTQNIEQTNPTETETIL
jgi:PadR family transcriptional regulator PadR